MRSFVALSFLLANALACQETPPATGAGTAATNVASTPKSAAAAAAPKAAARPQKELTVTVDGKPVEMVTAFASTTSDGKTTIELSSVPLTCADFSGNGRFLADGEVTFSVTFEPRLLKDGTVVMQPARTYFEGMNETRTMPGKLSGDGAEGKSTTAEVEVETESAGDKKQKLVAKGKIDAIGCPAPKSSVPELPPATELSMEVAGKKLPIRSAWIEDEPEKRTLKLYTGGEDCKGSGHTGDVAFEIELEKGAPWQIRFGISELVGQALSQTFDKKTVKVKLPEKAPGDVELDVDTVLDEYPVKIKGKVAAQPCVR